MSDKVSYRQLKPGKGGAQKEQTDKLTGQKEGALEGVELSK